MEFAAQPAIQTAIAPAQPAQATPAPVAPAPSPPKMRAPKTVVLKRSGITVVYDEDFGTEDVIAAQKAAGKETALFSLYLAQRIALFDGAKLTMGDIRDKVRGRDYLQLTAAMLGDGDDEGN